MKKPFLFMLGNDSKPVFDEIHLNQFPEATFVKISKDFSKHLRNSIKINFKSLKKAYNFLTPSMNFSTFKQYLKPSHKGFLSLKILLKLCRQLRIPLNILEKNIIAFKLNGRTAQIKARLPIKVNPLFYMVAAHVLADGYIAQGKSSTIIYRQYDEFLRNAFARKVKSVFGEFDTRSNEAKAKAISVPGIIGLIILKYYGLRAKDCLSSNASLKPLMKSASSEQLLAILIAFVLDEGHIDSSLIYMNLKNKGLIEDLYTICERLDYKSKIAARGDGLTVLYILKDGMIRLYNNYLLLKEKFPEVCLGYKEKALEEITFRMQKEFKSEGCNVTKNKIIQLLQESPKTIKELSSLLAISRQGIKFHVRKLLKQGVIAKEGKAKHGADIYLLRNFIKLQESNKGRSRQFGMTTEKILKLLQTKPRSTLELTEKFKIDKNTLRSMLYKLEQKNKIKRVGKKYTGANWAVVWNTI